MISVRDIPPGKFVNKLKEELKGLGEISPPSWAKFVKSGVHRERSPEQEDFWFIRTASVLRRIYLDGPVGVSRLRSYYGGARKKGSRPKHFRKASGNIIRKILQQLEKANFIEKNKKGKKITNKGREFLNKIAQEMGK
jgi:small subunit ribosomal protein S19e